MSKSIAVVISDLHFNVNSLKVASAALKQALVSARTQGLPLIIAGDLHDTKSIIRAEVANELVQLFTTYSNVNKYILVGNHDLLNEKSENHGLNYLRPYANIVDHFSYAPEISEKLYFIPYQSSLQRLREILTYVDKDSLIIMHQGVSGAYMGDYIVDNSSIASKELASFKVISGHYHRHQTVGTLTYIGSPYTTSFSEAHDGPKGFLILSEDGSYIRELTNLRKHIIIEHKAEEGELNTPSVNSDDIVQIRVEGTRSQLDLLTREYISKKLGRDDFKFDKVIIDTSIVVTPKTQLSAKDLFDTIIDELPDAQAYKDTLKALWKHIL